MISNHKKFMIQFFLIIVYNVTFYDMRNIFWGIEVKNLEIIDFNSWKVNKNDKRFFFY